MQHSEFAIHVIADREVDRLLDAQKHTASTHIHGGSTKDFVALVNSLPYWGVGNVARVDGCLIAVEFKGVGFSPLKSETDGEKPKPDRPAKPPRV